MSFHSQKVLVSSDIKLGTSPLKHQSLLTSRPWIRSPVLAPSCESGAWLSSIEMRKDNTTVQVAVGLWLGTKVCKPHQFYHFNGVGNHGLSCKWSEDYHNHHAALFIMSAAKIPSQLEPSGTIGEMGKVLRWYFGTSCLGCYI